MANPRPSWKLYSDSRKGIAVHFPGDWLFRSAPLPGVIDPKRLFACSNYSLPGQYVCKWLEALPGEGAAVWLIEWIRLARLGGSPNDFAARPTRFTLEDYPLGQHDCLREVPPDYTIPFESSGRFFWFQVALGPNAPSEVKTEVIELLSSLTVDPRPNPTLSIAAKTFP